MLIPSFTGRKGLTGLISSDVTPNGNTMWARGRWCCGNMTPRNPVLQLNDKSISKWDLQNNTSESRYKQKQTHRHGKQTFGYQRGEGRGRTNWEHEINRYKLLHIT